MSPSPVAKNKKTYIFLDEIQNVPEFEKTVDSLFINKDVDIYNRFECLFIVIGACYITYWKIYRNKNVAVII